jgi:hypothetical protein
MDVERVTKPSAVSHQANQAPEYLNFVVGNRFSRPECAERFSVEAR